MPFACSSPAPTVRPDARLKPPSLNDGIEVGTPEEVSLRPEVLTAALTAARGDPDRDLSSLLVARRGRLVVEAYFNGANRQTPHDIRSAAKSITGTLVGIALNEGRIRSLDQPFLDFLGGPGKAADPGQATVTIRHLLEMRSGIAGASDWDLPEPASAENRMAASLDWLRYALSLPMAVRPGERFAYASLNTMILGRVVQAATGVDLEAYAREKLFAPLQFGRYEWERDNLGQVVAQGSLHLRPRDLIKVGLLYLQGGRWGNSQIVPIAWIDEATRPRHTLPPDPATGQGDLYTGYGYHWWTVEERLEGGRIPVYLASGNGGQKLFVAPLLELAMVVTSSAYNRARAHRRSHALFRQILTATTR
jgi:CubicO group peptidase (beta-lactamase class C family)